MRNHQVTTDEMGAIPISQTLVSCVSARKNINKRLIFEYDIEQGVEAFVVVDHNRRLVFNYLSNAVDTYNAI